MADRWVHGLQQAEEEEEGWAQVAADAAHLSSQMDSAIAQIQQLRESVRTNPRLRDALGEIPEVLFPYVRCLLACMRLVHRLTITQVCWGSRGTAGWLTGSYTAPAVAASSSCGGVWPTAALRWSPSEQDWTGAATTLLEHSHTEPASATTRTQNGRIGTAEAAFAR